MANYNKTNACQKEMNLQAEQSIKCTMIEYNIIYVQIQKFTDTRASELSTNRLFISNFVKWIFMDMLVFKAATCTTRNNGPNYTDYQPFCSYLMFYV